MKPGFVKSLLYLTVTSSIFITTAQAQFTFLMFDVPGATGTFPFAINNNGDVTGYYVDASGTQSGFIRKADGTFVTFDLSSVNGTLRQVTGINDVGAVAGTVNINGMSFPNAFQGFVRDAQGNVSTFSAPPNFPDLAVAGVAGLNNAGESIIQLETGSGPQTHVLRTAANTYTLVPDPPGGVGEIPYRGLNNNGEAVGTSENPDIGSSSGFILDLSSLQFTFFFNSAVAVNDSGIVFGTCLDGANLTIPPEPFYYGVFQSVEYLRGADGSLLQSFALPFPLAPVPPLPSGLNNAGEIIGQFTDAIGTHGFIGVPASTASIPSISVVAINPGPPEQVVFSVVDPVGGIFDVLTVGNNCTVGIDAFTPGQTAPITVTATKSDPNLKAIVGIEAWNAAGNLTDFDPAILTVYGAGRLATGTLSNVPPSEHVLTVANGDPGLDHLRIQVNRRTLVVPLVRNETRTINLQQWMTSADNTIELSGEGAENGQASVVLKDGPSRPPAASSPWAP